MEEATADDLAARVRKVLRDTSPPPWFPGLTDSLADTAWSKLGRDFQPTRASYGTARLLRGDPQESTSGGGVL